MAKGQKTGGRKKGSVNRNRIELIESVRQGGEMPLDYMLRVMRDDAADQTRRDDMAKAAAPFVHSKMPTAIVTPARAEAPVTEDDERLLDLYLNGLHDEADAG